MTTNTLSSPPLWYRPARQLAMQALYQHHFYACEMLELEHEHLERNKLPKAQQIYFRKLLCGVVWQCDDLDALLDPLLDRSLERLDVLERVLLRIGTWELQKDPSIPPRKVIAENVYLAGVFGATDSYKYINAVLHKLADSQHLL